MKLYTVGIDVGGTGIKFGLANRSGAIITRSHLETKPYRHSKTKLINALVEEVKRLIRSKNLTAKNIQGIGIGLPGLIDFEKGVVNFLPNIPGWKNVPLKKIIQSKLRIPVFIDNDVNLITLAEWKRGSGKGVSDLVCLTIGTGVGAGLIFNNQLYRGKGFVAGELGHMPLNEKGPKCTCGGFACFERYVGHRSLRNKARKILRRNINDIPDVYKLASNGNKRALKFYKEAGAQIGAGLIGITNLLNPSMIIIGGGVSNNFKFFAPEMRRVVRARAMSVQGKMARIVKAALGNDAGIIGAQVLVKESLN